MDDNDKQVVLVAEDDETLAYFLRRHLESEGYNTTIVEKGSETLRLAPEINPDIIILDVGLPDTDGLTVCKRLKKDTQTADIPVLFLTARGDIEERVAGLSAGAQDYLVKPFAIPELQARVKAILRSRREANEAKKQINRSQQNIFNVFNDEMLTPLTVINMASQILTENQQLSSQRRDQLILSIRNSAEQLTGIIDDLLYLINPAKHVNVVNIHNIVAEIEKRWTPRAEENNQRLIFRGLRDIPLVDADATRLRKTLNHLIDNALKFTPRGGVITFTTALKHANATDATFNDSNGATSLVIPSGLIPTEELRQDWIIFVVRDTGIGISPEHHKYVFQPFYQVDSSTTRVTSGLGLGLAVVAAFVRTHHGRLAVRSGNDQGTTVHLALPVKQTAISFTSSHLDPNEPEGA